VLQEDFETKLRFNTLLKRCKCCRIYSATTESANANNVRT